MKVENGLDNIVAAETVLSHVDGAAGQLIIRGRTLDELASGTYEEAAALLLEGFFNDLPDDLADALGEARVEVADKVGALAPQVKALSTFDALRVLMGMLNDDSSVHAGLRLIAAHAVIVPMLLRQEANAPQVAPDAKLGHAEDMLRMAGLPHGVTETAGLNRYLISVIDHGLNASTFTARVVASTQAGLTSSVLAALGALKGPLHGGAPGPVLDMFDAIGTAENAESWITNELSEGRRLMGFGHRIYRVRDPRADALKAALAGLRSDRLTLAGVIEQEALSALARHKPERKLETNVEFYTAVLLEALGFPRDTFTCVFAAGRVTGWIAHALEQAGTGRLIRPQSRYAGPLPQQAA